MTDCKTFNGVTETIFSCVKSTSYKQHKTIYAPADGNQGKATTDVPAIGTIVLSFNFDPTAETITYCILQKPLVVSANQIFGGISDTIDGCRATTRVAAKVDRSAQPA